MGYRKVKMKTRLAGPDGGAAPGEVRAFDELRARLLVEGGYAEYVDLPAPEAAALPAPEVAAIAPPEAAVMESPKPRVARRRR